MEFIQKINSLKESSKDAIIDGEVYSLNGLKQYLHVERPIETKLKDLIQKSENSKISQLILVCGNVGDGKSHILSWLHKFIPNDFKIHNDATESFNPDESFIDTLDKILSDFKDLNLKKSTSKVILAINLGTLNNFLETKKNDYKKLYSYVHDKGILDLDVIQEDGFSSLSHFQYVNFTDYQLYELTAEGAQSMILSSLMKKIFSESNDNPIYHSYKEFEKEIGSVACPIIYNWRFLSEESNRETVVQLILKSIIKSKEVVSLRSILNFIHDIIIPLDYQQSNITDLKSRLNSLDNTSYVINILPNYLFEHPELSNLFEKISFEDPCNFRTEQSDENIIRVVNLNKIEDFINKQLPSKVLIKNLASHLNMVISDKNIVSKTFLRLLYFSDGNLSELSDPYFNKYLSFLYHYNIKGLKKLKELSEIVSKACINWNGNPEKERSIVLPLGARHNNYRILVPFKPILTLDYIPVPEAEVLIKFRNQIRIEYKNDSSESIPLHIDYSLLRLLIKVSRGYRPNKLDTNSFINFVNFLNELIELGVGEHNLEIDEINVGKDSDYRLSFDETFDEYKFEDY